MLSRANSLQTIIDPKMRSTTNHYIRQSWQLLPTLPLPVPADPSGWKTELPLYILKCKFNSLNLQKDLACVSKNRVTRHCGFVEWYFPATARNKLTVVSPHIASTYEVADYWTCGSGERSDYRESTVLIILETVLRKNDRFRFTIKRAELGGRLRKPSSYKTSLHKKPGLRDPKKLWNLVAKQD